MTKNKFKKILVIIILFIVIFFLSKKIFIVNSFDNYDTLIENDKEVKQNENEIVEDDSEIETEKEHLSFFERIVKERKQILKKVLETTKEYSDKTSRISIKGNDTLLVGDSRAYGLSYVVDGVDYITVSGVFDEELKYYLTLLDKKYKKVIIISSVNNVLSDSKHGDVLTQATMDDINELLMEAKNRVQRGGNLYYYDNELGDKYEKVNEFFKTVISNLEKEYKDSLTILHPEYSIKNSESLDGLHFASINENKLLWYSILEFINKTENNKA